MMFAVKKHPQLRACMSRKQRGAITLDHRETQDHCLTCKGCLHLNAILAGQCVPAAKTKNLLLLVDLEPSTLLLPSVKELIHPGGTRH